MAVADQLFEQALTLPEEERRKLTDRLLRTFQDDLEGDLLTDEAWQESWRDELQRRARATDEGKTKLLEGEAVLAEAFAIATARRP
jgi:Putative addiction module component